MEAFIDAHIYVSLFLLLALLSAVATLLTTILTGPYDPPSLPHDTATHRSALETWLNSSAATPPARTETPDPLPHTSQVVEGGDSLPSLTGNKNEKGHGEQFSSYKRVSNVTPKVGDYVLIVGESGPGQVTGMFGETYVVEMCGDNTTIFCTRACLTVATDT